MKIVFILVICERGTRESLFPEKYVRDWKKDT